MMIDHTGIGVADVARSAAFYDAALGALGLRRVTQLPENDGADAVGYGVDYPAFRIDHFHPHSVKQHDPMRACQPGGVDRHSTWRTHLLERRLRNRVLIPAPTCQQFVNHGRAHPVIRLVRRDLPGRFIADAGERIDSRRRSGRITRRTQHHDPLKVDEA